ncbi:hypothetical protein TREES_T100018502 [Tupaia chinensis]|uniref:Uncharacterized protein n=1 Tax=Tupaia chinensis TaxID=246437 RepID=L9L221_TUPCH|nr:hypothetical protein TREES_T100018502 [Tupaia chinensis]
MHFHGFPSFHERAAASALRVWTLMPMDKGSAAFALARLQGPLVTGHTPTPAETADTPRRTWCSSDTQLHEVKSVLPENGPGHLAALRPTKTACTQAFGDRAPLVGKVKGPCAGAAGAQSELRVRAGGSDCAKRTSSTGCRKARRQCSESQATKDRSPEFQTATGSSRLHMTGMLLRARLTVQPPGPAVSIHRPVQRRVGGPGNKDEECDPQEREALLPQDYGLGAAIRPAEQSARSPPLGVPRKTGLTSPAMCPPGGPDVPSNQSFNSLRKTTDLQIEAAHIQQQLNSKLC